MEKGEFVRVDYVGRLETGEIFDLTREDVAKKENVYRPEIKYRPVPVIIGAGFIIQGVDKALEGMKIGDKKEIQVTPEEGFGKRDSRLVRILQKKVFDGQVEPRQGLIVDFSGMKGRIQSVSGGRITVDFNNPMAGKTLKYDIEVKEKIEGSENQVKAVLEFFGIDKSEVKFAGKAVDIETSRLPGDVKNRIGKIIIDNIKIEGGKIDKIRFIDVFEKEEVKE